MADKYDSANMDMHFSKIKYVIRNTIFLGDFIAIFVFHKAASYTTAKLPSLAQLCGTVLQMTFLWIIIRRSALTSNKVVPKHTDIVLT